MQKEKKKNLTRPLTTFHYPPRIVICCDSLRSKRALEETLIHELVHAFDASRKGKFTSPCHLVACGEVRASKLGNYLHWCCNGFKALLVNIH